MKNLKEYRFMHGETIYNNNAVIDTNYIALKVDAFNAVSADIYECLGYLNDHENGYKVKGVAICHADDVYDELIGNDIASFKSELKGLNKVLKENQKMIHLLENSIQKLMDMNVDIEKKISETTKILSRLNVRQSRSNLKF